jgi:hypothetical protein
MLVSDSYEKRLGNLRTRLRPTLLIYSLMIAGLMPAAEAQMSQDTPDPRGPVAGWVGRTLVDADGVQTVGYRYTPPAEASWQPRWIWVAGSPSRKEEDKVPVAAQFRKEITLPADAPLTSALAKVSADRVYRLWINGHLVSRGPADAGTDEYLSTHWSHQWLYNSVDLAPYLHGGINVIAAEVFSAETIPSFSLGHAGFAMEATISLASGTAPMVIATGADWKAKAIDAYSEGVLTAWPPRAPNTVSPAGLLYDARKDNPAWKSASYAASDWAPAASVEPVWGTLKVSQIPEAMEAVWPVESIGSATPNVSTSAPLSQPGHSITVAGDGAFSVNFGRVLSGYVSIEVRGAAGTVITLAPSETHDGPPSRCVQITLRDGETIFEYPFLDSFSTVRVTVSSATQPVEFDEIRATFASQPVVYRGTFTSSDPYLNRLWTTARWLLQICMQDHYLDSPNHQEPIGDFGDYLIESLENDYAFNEPWLARQDMRKFAGVLDHAGSANFHTSYALLWLQMLMDYYDHTGDEQLLRELKPTADRLLDHFATFRGANGILSEAPNYMFMDWVTIDGFQTHHPPAVIGQGYMTAFYYRALADGARLATITGDSARAATYEKQRTAIYAAFNRELWDETAGLYRDGKPYQNHQTDPQWLPADKDIVTHSVQGNSLAVLYDLAPKERQKAIMEKLFMTEPLNVQPYFMHFVFAAEDHAGVFDRYAWVQMQRWHLNLETKTFNENWYGGDWSHAWGGTPLIQMSSRILGVTPAAPGYKRVAIRPELCGLQYAKGVVPTVAGDIAVAWAKSDAKFTLDVLLPQNISADVTLPVMAMQNAVLMVDGKAVASYRSGAVLTLTGGAHSLVLQAR